MICLGLTYCTFFLLSLSTRVSGRFDWINPPPPWVFDNQVWATDSLHNLTWTTGWSVMELKLIHVNVCRLPDPWTQPDSMLFEQTATPEYYMFKASIPEANLSKSNMFYFGAIGRDSEDNGQPMATSHFFNISNITTHCDRLITSSSPASGTSTLSTTSTSSSAVPPDMAPDKAATSRKPRLDSGAIAGITVGILGLMVSGAGLYVAIRMWRGKMILYVHHVFGTQHTSSQQDIRQPQPELATPSTRPDPPPPDRSRV